MMYRKERPRCRKAIERILKDKNWTMKELYEYFLENKYHFSPGLRVQIRKMYSEYQKDEFSKNLEYTIHNGRRIPVVRCKREETSLVFFCHFCGVKHYHTRNPGYRHAHCGYNSPFQETGYVLKLEDCKK